MAPTTHPFHKVIYVASGSGAITGASARSLANGSLISIPAGVRHHFTDLAKTPLCLLGLCVGTDAVATNPLVASAWSALTGRLPAMEPRIIADEYRRSQIERRMRAMIFEQTRSLPSFESVMWGQALELIAEIMRAQRPSARPRSTPGTTWFAATLTWLEHHFHQPVSVRELAARAHMSYRGYTARFRATTGVSVVTHLNRLRIAHAQRLLRSGTAVLDAAYASGYGDLSHFYRHFKRLTGRTPASWAAVSR